MKTEVIICTRVMRKNIGDSGNFASLSTDSAELTQKFQREPAGAYWVQQLNIVLNSKMPQAADLQLIPQLFELTDSNAKTFTWGDSSHKSYCVECTRVGNANRIVFQRKATSPLV